MILRGKVFYTIISNQTVEMKKKINDTPSFNTRNVKKQLFPIYSPFLMFKIIQ